MPVQFYWDEKSRTVRTRLWGHVTNEDLVGNAQKVIENPRIRAPLKELVDLREVESTDVTIDGLRSVVRFEVDYADRFRGWRQAIVAPTEELRSMARAFVVLSDVHRSSRRVRIFETLIEAEDWLDSPDSEGRGIHAARPGRAGR